MNSRHLILMNANSNPAIESFVSFAFLWLQIIFTQRAKNKKQITQKDSIKERLSLIFSDKSSTGEDLLAFISAPFAVSGYRCYRAQVPETLIESNCLFASLHSKPFVSREEKKRGINWQQFSPAFAKSTSSKLSQPF